MPSTHKTSHTGVYNKAAMLLARLQSVSIDLSTQTAAAAVACAHYEYITQSVTFIKHYKKTSKAFRRHNIYIL